MHETTPEDPFAVDGFEAGVVPLMAPPEEGSGEGPRPVSLLVGMTLGGTAMSRLIQDGFAFTDPGPLHLALTPDQARDVGLRLVQLAAEASAAAAQAVRAAESSSPPQEGPTT